MTGQTSSGLEPRLASVLCYSAWWVTGLVFLALERDHPDVRFHAAQATVVFGGLSLLLVVLGGLSLTMLFVSAAAFQAARVLAELGWLSAVLLWLTLMYRTSRGDTWRVPVAALLADRLSNSLPAA